MVRKSLSSFSDIFLKKEKAKLRQIGKKHQKLTSKFSNMVNGAMAQVVGGHNCRITFLRVY